MRDIPVEAIACFVGLALVAMFASVVCRKIRFPCTIGLVIVGMVLYKLGGVFTPLNVLQRVHLTPNFILYILLPTLIFDAAINLDARELMRNIWPIFLLAAPGVLVATAVTGLACAGLTPLGLNAAMLFGALISTTDTAAVLALFNEIGAPKRLGLIVDGESLFNDATAIVVFNIVSGIVAASLLLPNPTAAWNLPTLLAIPGKFSLVFFGGAAVGAVVGWVIMQIIRFSRHDPLIEVGLTTVVAYAAFILANFYFEFSGVMAAVGAGMVVNYYGRRFLSESMREALRKFWGFAAFMANSIIFLLLGLTQFYLVGNVGRLRDVGGAIVVAIIFVLLARVVIVALFSGCCNLFYKKENRITLPMQVVMFWGGLRGALPIALAVSIGATLVTEAERALIIQLTLAIILFTMLVQGATLSRLMRRLGIHGNSGASE